MIEYEHITDIDVAFDGDRESQVQALVDVARSIATVANEGPMEPVMLLLVAAARCIDTLVDHDRNDVDMQKLTHLYIQIACQAWNLNEIMFHTDDPVTTNEPETKETLQ